MVMAKARPFLVLSLAAAMLAACAGEGAQDSKAATAEDPMVLMLAHNLSTDHVTSVALSDFADTVEENTDGRITVQIYPNGQLGSETEVIEQLRADILDMTRVSAPGLSGYNEGYHAFGLPYIFDDQEHYYASMDSDEMREYFMSSYDDGFVGLTYYTSGSRSFYANEPIRTPADLAGMKIRVQDMRSQTDMMHALGGTPVVIPFGDIYTSLQTGIIDGAESNETALTQSSHGDVSKVFSYDEHSMIPDMLIMSTATWDSLSADDQDAVIEAAIESTESHKIAWDEEIQAAKIEAQEEMGVEFIEDVDKEAFQEATAPMIDQYISEYPLVGDVLDIVEGAR